MENQYFICDNEMSKKTIQIQVYIIVEHPQLPYNLTLWLLSTLYMFNSFLLCWSPPDINLLLATICTGKFNTNFKFYWKGSKIFAMVISLYLHVFSHRQLYVAFSSRVISGSGDQKIGSLFDGSSGSYPQTKILKCFGILNHIFIRLWH